MDGVPAQAMGSDEVERLVRGRTPLMIVQAGGYDLEAEFGDAVRLVTVAAEDLPGLSDRLHLDCLPGVLLIKRGRVFDRFLGRLPRRLVMARVRAMLDAA